MTSSSVRSLHVRASGCYVLHYFFSAFLTNMSESVERRYCIKLCQKLGDNQTETIRKIKEAFGHDAMGRSQIQEWFNRFKERRTSVESDPRSGRPSTSRNEVVINTVHAVIMEDHRLTIHEISEELGISVGSVNSILKKDLGMWRVAAKFVPKLLSHEQQELRLSISQDMLDCVNANTMAPCEFWLFPKLKHPLKGSRFDDRDERIRNATTQLLAIPARCLQNLFPAMAGTLGEECSVPRDLL